MGVKFDKISGDLREADTPKIVTGTAGKVVRVNPTETGYELATPGSSGASGSKLGAWDSLISYFIGDIVNYNGLLYKAITSNDNKQPNLNPTDWKIYYPIKHNFGGTAAPTVNDDSTAGYEVGSRWIDTVANESYICLDKTAGAAIWEISTASLASEIINTPAGNIVATNVQGAIDELDTEKAIDSDVVHITGNESIGGEKDFTDIVKVSATGTATTPSVSLGDGDSGLYEATDDQVSLALNGVENYRFSQAYMQFGASGGYPGITRELATATNPVFVPVRDDLDTGIGSAGANQLSLIAGGVEGIRINDTNAHSVSGIVDYETLVTDDDDIPNKKYIDDIYNSNAFGSQDIWVDINSDVATKDGSILRPYSSLQDAMTAIGVPTSDADSKRKITVHIKAGEYDEDVSVPQQRMITFLCYGTVVLGDGASDVYDSATPRNLTILNTATGEQAGAPSRPTFCIKGISGDVSSTHSAYGSGNFLISGDLQFNHVDGNTTSHETFLSGVKVYGDVTINANEAGCVHNFQCEKCFFDNTFNASSINLNIVRSTEFDGLITATSVGRFIECEIDGGITAGMNDYYPPSGFYNCEFGGGTVTMTTIKVDAVTKKTMIDNGVTLTGTYVDAEPYISTFIDLTDSPANYTGSAGKYPKVNVGETGLEFATISALGVAGTKVGAWDNTENYVANDIVNYNGTIYKSISTNDNKQPDTNLSDWEVYTKTITSDTITEVTTDNGVNIENVNLKDGGLILPTLTDTNYGVYIPQLSEDTATQKTGFYIANLEDPTNQVNVPSSRFFSFRNSTTAPLSNRTTTPCEIRFIRYNNSTSGTVTDNFDLMQIRRKSGANGAGGTYEVDGSVLFLENSNSIIAGTLNDNSTVLELLQSSTSTGGHFRLNVYTGTPITNNTFWYDGANLKYLDNSGNTITLGNIPLTTKGDIFTFDTDGQRLAVGTDGQVLTADSGEATGLKWADASGGLDSAENLDVDTGTETVDTFADTDCDACHWHYLVKNGTNLRTGTIMSVWEATGDTVEYTETSTNDIGDTSDLTFTVDINTDNVRLLATTTSDDWIVKVKRIQI